MTKKNDAISTANKIAYALLSICLGYFFIKSHHTALAVAQPLPNSLAYITGMTGWLQDERRLLILTFALAATPLVIIFGVLLCRSLAAGGRALSSAFACVLSMGTLFAMSWLGPFAFFLLPAPVLSLVFLIVNLVKAPSLLLELSVLAELVTLAILPCYALWWFAVFVD